MSSPNCIQFCSSDGEPAAIISLFYGGSRESCALYVNDFFSAVKHQPPHVQPRFNDPWLLAAKFVVWMASEMTKPDKVFFPRGEPLLGFSGIGICIVNPAEYSYICKIICLMPHEYRSQTFPALEFLENSAPTGETP